MNFFSWPVRTCQLKYALKYAKWQITSTLKLKIHTYNFNLNLFEKCSSRFRDSLILFNEKTNLHKILEALKMGSQIFSTVHNFMCGEKFPNRVISEI